MKRVSPKRATQLRRYAKLRRDFLTENPRCIRCGGEAGETVLSPFAGIGSEGYVAIGAGRRFIGVELKPSYWRTAVDNLTAREQELTAGTLFDEATA